MRNTLVSAFRPNAVLLCGLLALAPPAQAAASIVVSRAEPYAETVNPGASLALTFQFRSLSPTDTPHKVLLQFLDANGNTAFSTEHDPAVRGPRRPTTEWAGDVRYTLPGVHVPDVPAGTYRIVLSLAEASTGARLQLLRWSQDLYTASLPSSRYQVGLLNVTTKPIVDADVVCDGSTDVSSSLRSALDSARPGTVLRLPAGTCVYSALYTPPPDNCTDQSPLPLRLPHGARDITVVGRGAPSTTLKALNVDTSALFADAVSGLQVRDLTLASAGTQRRLCPVANGISIFSSSAVDITRVVVSKSAAAGILLFAVQDGRVSSSRVQDSLADGIQATHASRRITIDGNTIVNSGDDAVSSTGHTPFLNDSFTVTGNTLVGSKASGVAVEGTSNTTISNNTIQDSGVAGLRIASVSSFQTGPVNGVLASGNTLAGVRRDATVDHAAVMIFADHGNVSHIALNGNRITGARTGEAFRVRGSLNADRTAPAFWASDITITNNVLTDLGARLLKRCVGRPLPSTLANVVMAGNTLNGTVCPAQE